VHLEHCPNIDALMFDPQRKIEVNWATSEGGSFTVKLLVRSEDRQGLLARVTAAIAEEDANIKDIRADTTEDQRGEMALTLTIRDRGQLDRILQRLRQLEGVMAAERILG
jgi:GTP pyrophosphokinase